MAEEQAPPGSVGVALSGGGHRATVWAFGALLALVDMRVNEHVTSMSSVSGGSFSNAVVAQDLDFRRADAHQAEAAFRPMSRMIAYDGLFLWGPSTNVYSWATYSAMGLGAVSLLAGLVVGLAWHPAWWWMPAVVGLVLLAVGGWAAEQRGRVVDAALARLFFHHQGRPTLLGALERDVHHVLCATELQSGEHFYLAPEAVASWEFGTGTPGDLRLSTAVQMSACVPAGFPPHRVPVSRFGIAHPTHDRAVLVDGGVYDNMAEEWFLPPGGHPGPVLLAGRRVEQLVVVNASPHEPWSDFRPSRLPVLSEAQTAIRSSGVAFDATTSLRRRFEIGGWMAQGDRPGGALVSIAQSPYTVLDAQLPEQQQARVARATRWLLPEDTREMWDERVARDRAVRTTLGRLGPETTIDLLEHAYVVTAVNLHVLLGHELRTEKRPSRDRFARVLG